MAGRRERAGTEARRGVSHLSNRRKTAKTGCECRDDGVFGNLGCERDQRFSPRRLTRDQDPIGIGLKNVTLGFHCISTD